MTLNGVMALILRYFTEFGIVSGAHCVKAVDDKPYTYTFCDFANRNSNQLAFFLANSNQLALFKN